MVIDKSEIYAKIVSIIADQLNIGTNTIESGSTLETLGADSLDQVEIIMKLEEEFDIEINDKDAEKLTTVGDAVDYVYNLIKERK